MGSVSVHGVSATHAAHERDFLDVRAIGPMHLVGTGVRRRWPPLNARVCLRVGRPVGPLLGSHSRCCNTPVSFLTAVESPKLADPSRPDPHRPHHQQRPPTVSMYGLLRKP